MQAVATDLTVVAIPFYFGSMEVERRALKGRAETLGPSPADYTRDHAQASLTMGVASLVIPLASHLLVQRVVPGKGKYDRWLVGTAVGAAVVTTVADRLASGDGDDLGAMRPTPVGGRSAGRARCGASAVPWPSEPAGWPLPRGSAAARAPCGCGRRARPGISAAARSPGLWPSSAGTSSTTGTIGTPEH